MALSRAKTDLRPLTADEMANLSTLLEQRGTLVTERGDRITVPEPIYQLLCDIVPLLKQGHSVQLINTEQLVTTQVAADILGMSRPHLIKLLNEGVLSFTRVGEQRRLKLAEVLEYRDRRQRESEERLKELLAMAQETGTYQ
jgi:excisionase family DNA binding protein